MLINEKSRESKLRYALRGQGYSLRKSRVKQIHGNNLGGYMIVDANSNFVVCGSRFELNLDDVEQFANE